MALTRPRSYQLLDSDYKASCRAATTDPVTLSGSAPNTLDTSVTLVKGDRILVKDQTTGSENGIYVVQTLGTGANGTWVRAVDFNTSTKISSGLLVYIEEGDVNGDKLFALTTNNPITLGSTSLVFSQVTGGGGGGTPGGANTYVQFNDASTFGGDIDFTWIKSTNTLNVNGAVNAKTFSSNIATGTAPITVLSTTQVANLNVANAGHASTANTVVDAAQTNITSVGTLTGLSVNAQVNATTFSSNVTTGTAPFTVTSTTQVANLNVANAGHASTANTVVDASQTNITSVGTLTGLSVNAQVNATTFSSNVTTGTAPFTVTSTTQVANLNVATAGTASTAGTVTTNAQPNITSVGTLSSLTTSGDVTVGGNLTVNGTTTTINATELQVTDLNIVVAKDAPSAAAADGAGITVAGAAASLTYVNASNSWRFDRTLGANGTITGTQLISNITTGTAPFVVTSTTQVANLNVATAGSATTAGTVTTAAQPNITSVGNLTIANVDNIQIDGNTISSTNTNGNIDISPNGTGNINLNDSVQATSTIQATRFISNIATGTAPLTVTSTTQVANLNVATAGSATTAGTVTTAAQPNITSVGTLTSLGVSGAVTASTLVSNVATGTAPFTVSSTTQVANLNVATAGQVFGATTGTGTLTHVLANIADNDHFRILSGGTASDSGYAELATADNGDEPIYVRQYTGYFTTVARTATLLDASGNTSFPGTITGTRLISNIATGTAPFTVTSTTQVANLNVATAGTATSATTAGTVTTAAQPNITSVGTLTSLGVSGAVTASTYTSNVATGTAPFTVTSTTVVSNLNADLLDGLHVNTDGRADNANEIVRTDANGYIQAGWINTTSGDNGTTAIDRVYASSDGYIRYYTPTNFRTVLNVPTRTGGDASGTWPINITGNAATVNGFRNLGTITVQAVAGSGVSCTTAQFVSWYTTNYSFLSYGYTVAKVSWSYAGNNDISDTIIGALELAGCTIETFSDGTQYTIRITRPTTGAGAGTVLVYNDQGAGYSPGWRILLDNTNYNSYSPTLTGTGASGTWSINVTGSAGSATTATTATNWGAYGAVPAAGTSFGNASTIGRSDVNGYTYFGYINSSTGNSENPTVSQVIVTNGSDNFYRKASIAHLTSAVQSNASGNWSINATNLSTNRTNWSTNGTISAVVGQLCWKNYGNSHTIFDASNSTSPDGTAKNNTNPDIAWTGTYPTLMGWNGTYTYGVRVDSARYSDQSKYADLAEKYLADKEYPVGTVLMIGGTAEVTLAEKDSRAIVGVISENGFVMNADLKGEYVVAIGYIGRVPCKVKGKINRGDFLIVGDTPGVAVAADYSKDLTGMLIGKALQSHDSDNEGIIEVLVGRL